MGTAADNQTYCFREFELDLAAQQLRLHGTPIHLERRPFDLLVLLVTRHGQLVTRDEVIRQLWPGNVIIDFDTGLNTLVRKVRKALSDSPDVPAFVETVTGRGYRFIAPVTTADPEKRPADTVEQREAEKNEVHRNYTRTATVVAIFACIVALAIWRTVEHYPSEISIAVLPFENLTGSNEFDYLAAGLAEDTSVSLSQVDLPNLAVIGGVSAQAVFKSALPMQEIGRQTNIDYLVQSSLRLEQTRIRVTSRLIRVNDGKQVWSASFDRELTNVLGLQRDLSIAIAEQIRQTLSPDVAAELDRRQTRNPEAYKLYLRGRYEWTRFQPTSVARALDYYEQAVAIDPGYALAWAGIAHALITSQVTAGTNWDSIHKSSQDALQRALEYGPNLVETQLALGSFLLFIDWDWLSAEAAARRAVELDPNSAMSHMFLGIVLSGRGRHVEALAMLRRARELDPLFPLMFANSANVALESGDAQAALEFATQAVAINPEFWPGHLYLGYAHEALGNFDAALNAFSDTEKYSGGNSTLAVALRANLLATLGREDEARDILAELSSRSAKHHVSADSFALIYAGLGETDATFEWLERALDEHSINMPGLEGNRAFQSLRSDPRFESLLRRCGCSPQ